MALLDAKSQQREAHAAAVKPPSVQQRFLRLVLHFLIACAFAAFVLIQVFKPLTWFRMGHDWTQLTKNVNVRNHYQYHKVSSNLAKSSGYVLNSLTTEQVLWTFAPVWAAAVCTILLYEVTKGAPRKKHGAWLTSFKIQAKRCLFFQLYPRRFWIWWCGGLNVLDLTLVLTWVAFNLMWAYFTVQPKYVMIRAQIAQHKVTPHAGHLNMANQTASCIGTATMFSMTLLFFPVPRNTFLHYVFNTDFSGLLKYHRWLGYGVAWTAVLHGLMYYIYWAVKGGFYENWKKWGNDHSNNLAGTIAMFFLLLILCTSMSWVRRLYFQVFIRCHIIGFVGFTVFTYIHYWQRWWYQTPGLILLALDWTFRLAQWLHPSFVTGQFVTFDKSVITIRLTWRRAAAPTAGQFMFLNIPSGRRFQWHPVTIANVETGRPGRVLVTAHMKCYGKWTSTMVAHMLEGGRVLMRVDGPYGRPYGPGWHAHDALVILAGGIGATPMLGMLRDMAAQRKRAAEFDSCGSRYVLPFPEKVHLHWASRGVAEFSLLDSEILEASRDGWLELHLYATNELHGGSPPGSDGGSEELLNKESVIRGAAAGGFVRLPAKSVVSLGSAQAVASPYSFQPGVLEAYGSGWYWIAATTLAFLGAFFALLMSAAFDSNLALTGGQAKANWKTGLLVVIASFVGSMGLPALLIFPYNILRYRRRRQQNALAQKPSELMLADGSACEVLLHNSKVGSVEDGTNVAVQAGRPRIARILADAAACHADAASVGVFAAGPRSMTAEVKAACAAQNDTWRRPFLDFSSHAFDL